MSDSADHEHDALEKEIISFLEKVGHFVSQLMDINKINKILFYNVLSTFTTL